MVKNAKIKGVIVHHGHLRVDLTQIHVRNVGITRKAAT
jgi:hypothetical protein